MTLLREANLRQKRTEKGYLSEGQDNPCSIFGKKEKRGKQRREKKETKGRTVETMDYMTQIPRLLGKNVVSI
jgi:hypothetical protein